jgi:hypothetical protein
MKTSHVCLAVLAVLVASGASARELQTTFSSSSHCVASSTSSSTTASKSVCVKAYADAVAVGCSSDYPCDELVVKIYEKVKFWAKALVDVYTSAVAKCKTNGYAFGCADADAYASGQTKAFIELHAEACAAAFNGCNKCSANAASYVSADLLVKLLAKAKSASSASVCVGPNQTASAKAYSTCHAEVFAWGFAKAFAKALIKGDCTQLEATAVTNVDLVVNAFPECTCSVYTCAKVDGKCKTWSLNNQATLAKYEAVKDTYPYAYAYTKARCLAAATQVY